MHSLPYIKTNKEIVVPHLGLEYTLSLGKNSIFSPENLCIEDFSYENTFILIIENESSFLKFGMLCVLNSTQLIDNQKLITFFTLAKTKILSFVSEKVVFNFQPESNISLNLITKINNLCYFLKNNSNFSFLKDKIDYDQIDYNYILDQLAGSFTLSIDDDCKFYNFTSSSHKINLIYSYVFDYILMFSYDLDSSGQKTYSDYPLYVENKINFELSRLKTMNNSSAEYSNTLDYLDLVRKIPWNNFFSSTNLNPQVILNEMNKNHFGLDKIKDEILDFFYLEKLTGIADSSNFLFSGPPGTGKTSIAKSIANALGREFIFISLSGVSDESEIRGHRRTYLGSRPGRIVSEISKLKTANPVILLDEIDKVSALKNDVQSALLELLDKNQNHSFVDRYLEIPINLSKALFICTANNLQDISEPLKDRLSFIEFESYQKKEKKIIIHKYIFPSLITKYSMTSYNFSLESSFLDFLSENYTLRQIENILSKILRRKSKYIYKNSLLTTIITKEDFESTSPPLSSHKKRNIGFANRIN